MERREFVRSLIGVPLIARPSQKNKRAHHQGERIYHGPMRLSEKVLDIAIRAPAYRTTCRHPAIRLCLDGVTYVFRTGIAGNCYLGEIVRIPAGALRVHVWRAIEAAPPLTDILARKVAPIAQLNVESVEDIDFIDNSQYCDPKYAGQLMDEAMPAPILPPIPSWGPK